MCPHVPTFCLASWSPGCLDERTHGFCGTKYGRRLDKPHLPSVNCGWCQGILKASRFFSRSDIVWIFAGQAFRPADRLPGEEFQTSLDCTVTALIYWYIMIYIYNMISFDIIQFISQAGGGKNQEDTCQIGLKFLSLFLLELRNLGVRIDQDVGCGLRFQYQSCRRSCSFSTTAQLKCWRIQGRDVCLQMNLLTGG